MPLPAYIVCSQSGSIDETTNQVSAFNIVDAFKIFKRPIKSIDELTQKQIRSGLIRVVAAWIKEETDSADQLFDVSVIGSFPPNGQEVVFGTTQFSFSKPAQRIIIQDLLISKFWGPGVLKITARIRRVGEEDWLNVQIFSVILEEVPLPEVAADSTNQEPAKK